MPARGPVTSLPHEAGGQGQGCLNQNDEAVQVIIANLVVPRRPTPGGAEANMSEHLDPAGARVSSKYRRTTAAAPTGDH
jgi:hypothetical protein